MPANADQCPPSTLCRLAEGRRAVPLVKLNPLRKSITQRSREVSSRCYTPACQVKALTAKYLLYIDILGFSDMVRSEPAKVAELYLILDSLTVHRHEAFRTIVFSDTILVQRFRSKEWARS